MTLYELNTAAQELYTLLQSDEIDEQTVIDTLEGMGVEDKLEDCCKVVRQLEADALAYKTESDRLGAKQKIADNGAKRIKNNLLAYMNLTEQKKISCGLFSMLRRESSAIEITNEALLPESVFTQQAPKISKTKIKEMFDSGTDVKGAAIVKHSSITIK